MISVAMIVKNEVATIRDTIMSVKEHVDEVVIGVDEDSNDGTLKIAKELGDKVFTIYLSEELKRKGPRESENNKVQEWGFSRARNQVLDECKKRNWRLTLDGHETVYNPETMKEAIEEAVKDGCDGIEVMLNFEPDENGIPSLAYRQGRLFAPSVRYNNPLHNVPVVKKMFSYDEFKIEHRKQDQDIVSKRERDIQRSESTVQGFMNEVSKNPGNSRPWFYLGNACKENAKWEQAIGAYKQCLNISKWNEERWHARINMGTCHSCMGDTINAREQFVMAIEEFPSMAEAYYYLADLAYKQQRYREAQVWSEKCSEMPVPKCKLFVNPRIYLVNRYDQLSMVYHHLGRYEDAIVQAKKALENAPNPRIDNNIRCWEESIGRRKSA